MSRIRRLRFYQKKYAVVLTEIPLLHPDVVEVL